MENKVLLLTGGLGYIGSHGVIAFEKAGYKTVIVDNLIHTHRGVLDAIEQILGYKPDFFELDLRDKVGLEEVFRRYNFDGVLHFAGAKSPFESQQQPLYYYDNNLIGSLCLFEAMSRYKVKNIIFSSSANVYASMNSSPVDENGFLGPNNPYGRIKYMLEEILRDFYKVSGWNISLLRYFNPIGCHPSGHIGEYGQGVLPCIMKVICGDIDKFKVFGSDYDTHDGSCVRDYIDINDLIHGHLLAYKLLSNKGKPSCDVFNLGTGYGTSIFELLQLVEEVVGIKIKYDICERREGDLPSIFCNIDKVTRMLGFQCKVSQKESIQNTWKFYQNRLGKK